MCFGPLGKFKSYFSIVSKRAVYHREWILSLLLPLEHSRAEKNKTSYTAAASPQPHKIALPDQPTPPSPFLKTSSPCFCLSLPFLSFCLSLSVFVAVAPLVLRMTLLAPLLPRFTKPVFPTSCLWPPLLSGVFTAGPIMKGAQHTQRKPQSGPGDPRHTAHSPSSTRISHSEQSGSHGSVYVLQPYPSPPLAFCPNPSAAPRCRRIPDLH